MKKGYLLLILMFVMLSFSAPLHAQVRNADVILNIFPQYPNPNQAVTATVSSYVIDLNKANITWSLGGGEASMGIGKKSFTFNSGDTGSPLNLSVSVDTVDGQNITKTITITPAGVDLLFEGSDSYVPPFYRGRALVPSQGSFKIVAMPSLSGQNGKINASNLSYAWIQDGDPQPDSSGWGKNYYVFQNSYLDKGNTVEVKVSDIAGGNNAYGKIELKTSTPKIIFYKTDSSLGTLWENALTDGYQVNSSGDMIAAEPYFFSPKDISSSDLSFVWSINGEKIDTPNPKNILAIKPEAGQSGSAFINLAINNVNTLFQSLQKQISVSF